MPTLSVYLSKGEKWSHAGIKKKMLASCSIETLFSPMIDSLQKQHWLNAGPCNPPCVCIMYTWQYSVRMRRLIDFSLEGGPLCDWDCVYTVGNCALCAVCIVQCVVCSVIVCSVLCVQCWVSAVYAVYSVHCVQCASCSVQCDCV